MLESVARERGVGNNLPRSARHPQKPPRICLLSPGTVAKWVTYRAQRDRETVEWPGRWVACSLPVVAYRRVIFLLLLPSPPLPPSQSPLRLVHVLSKPRNGIHRSSERAKKKTESTCIDKLKAAQMFAIALTCLTTMEWYHVIQEGERAVRQGGKG